MKADRPGIGSFEPLHRGIDRKGQAGFVEKRAGDQATIGEYPPEGVEQRHIRRGRRIPEFVKLPLEGQTGDIIDRLAERNDG